MGEVADRMLRVALGQRRLRYMESLHKEAFMGDDVTVQDEASKAKARNEKLLALRKQIDATKPEAIADAGGHKLCADYRAFKQIVLGILDVLIEERNG